VNSQTTAGNTIGKDILPNYLVAIIRNGINGVVTFRVFHAQQGPNPRTFTVNTSSFPADLDLASAIAAGFQATGLGLQARVRQNGVANLVSSNGGDFSGSPYFVHIPNTNTINEIQVEALPGQSVVHETNALAAVPALNPWGILALVATFVLTSLWFLRRRFRTA